MATAILLVCDAWFDVSLAFGTPDVWFSAGLAVFVELPLAAFLVRRVYSLLSSTSWGPSTREPTDSNKPE